MYARASEEKKPQQRRRSSSVLSRVKGRLTRGGESSRASSPDSVESDASSPATSEDSSRTSSEPASPVLAGAGEATARRQSAILARLSDRLPRVSSVRSLLSSSSSSPSKELQAGLLCTEFLSPEWSDVSTFALPGDLPSWPSTQVKPLGRGDEGIRDAFVAEDGSKVFLIKTPASAWKLCFGLPEIEAPDIAKFFVSDDGDQLAIEACYARVDRFLAEHTPLDLMGHAVAQGLQEEMVAKLAKVVCGRLSPEVTMSLQQGDKGALCVTETWRVPRARPCSGFCSAQYGKKPVEELRVTVEKELSWLLSIESGFFQCMLARLLLDFADANPDSLLIQTEGAPGRRCYLIDYESGLAEVDLLDPHGLSAAERVVHSASGAAVTAELDPAKNLLLQFKTLCRNVATAFVGNLTGVPEKEAVLRGCIEESLQERLDTTVTVDLMRRLLSLLDFSHLAQAEERLNAGLATYFPTATEDSAVVNHLTQRLEYAAWRVRRFLDVFKVKLAEPLSINAGQFAKARRDLLRLMSRFNVRQQAPILLLVGKVAPMVKLDEAMALYSRCFSRATKRLETSEERFGELLDCLASHAVDLNAFKGVMLKLSTTCCVAEAARFNWNRVADSLNQMRGLMREQGKVLYGFECVAVSERSDLKTPGR